MSPEDLLAGPTVEEILKTPQFGPDGQEKEELPALERYYQRLATKRPGSDKPLQSKNEDLFGTPGKSNSRDERAPHEDSDLPSGVKESAQALTRAVRIGQQRQSSRPELRRTATCPTPSASETTRCRRSRCRSIRSSWMIIIPWWTRAGTRPPWPVRGISLTWLAPMQRHRQGNRQRACRAL